MCILPVIENCRCHSSLVHKGLSSLVLAKASKILLKGVQCHLHRLAREIEAQSAGFKAACRLVVSGDLGACTLPNVGPLAWHSQLWQGADLAGGIPAERERQVSLGLSTNTPWQ